MTKMQPEDLQRVLTELEIPRQTVLGNGGYEHVPVWRLVAFASRVCQLGEDAEEQVDAIVNQIGGQRLAVVDPWRVVPDVVRRMRRKPVPPRDDQYAIPKSFLSRDGDLRASTSR